MTDSKRSEIIGHKTVATGKTGDTGFPELRHEPLTHAEAAAISARADAAREKRAADMPTEESAVRAMCDAFLRLKELGWEDVMYLSDEKRGTVKLIEAGSSGIHEGEYYGTWPNGSWWIHDGGDLWPSRPCLGKIKEDWRDG